MTFSLPSI